MSAYLLAAALVALVVPALAAAKGPVGASSRDRGSKTH